MVHHARGLAGHCNDPDYVEALKADPATVATTPRLRALIDHVIKLTRTPGAMRRADVEALRAAGFSDEGIVGINQITGFFAWCNRTVDGLGVDLEDVWPHDVHAAHPHPPD